MAASGSPSNPVFLADAGSFRAWLQAHHATATELWVGFWKRATGRPSITWPEAVDQALCFGWIDGVRRSLDAEAYVIRFTPRKPTSTWSAVNIARMKALIEQGLTQPAGLAAFEGYEARTNRYSFEREQASLPPEEEQRFRAHDRAWAFFQAQPPGYRKTVLHWVTSARRPETRVRRLDGLIRESAAERRIDLMRPPAGAS